MNAFVKACRKSLRAAGILAAAFAAVVAGDAGIRHLTNERKPLKKFPGDITESRMMFGDQIQYDKVVFVQGRFSFLQPPGSCVTLGSTIYDDSDGAVSFYHEMAHVWKNHTEGRFSTVTAALALWLKNKSYAHTAVYIYTPDPRLKLSDYNFEQQASIIEDYIRSGIDSTHEASIAGQTRCDSSDREVLEKIIRRSLPLNTRYFRP